MKTECDHCGKTILNGGSLAVHEKYYCKLNPDRKKKKSYFTEYNEKVRTGEIQREFKNQFDKALSMGTEFVVSEETRKKISDKSKLQVWTEEKRQRHSISMINAVAKHPESYSAHNVSGRTKKIEYNGMKVTGKWELEVAMFLDKKGLEWTNLVKPFKYFWGEKIRSYFPDFYLPALDLYLEVKGNQTERDETKWSVVENLMIIKNDGIKDLRKGIDLELKPNNPYFGR
jgi:hypothetical protein